jgi:hypothetical protein
MGKTIFLYSETLFPTLKYITQAKKMKQSNKVRPISLVNEELI